MEPSEAARFNKYVAANVRLLRERQGLTQEQLAEAAELAWTYIQRIEQGRANPTVRVLTQVALALGTTPAQLFRRATLRPRGVGRPAKS